jgi:hypothetical protein
VHCEFEKVGYCLGFEDAINCTYYQYKIRNFDGIHKELRKREDRPTGNSPISEKS